MATRRGLLWTLLLAPILFAPAVGAQSAEAEPAEGLEPAAEVLPEPDPPVVLILGASVSSGFVFPQPRDDGERNSGIELARALRAMWPDDAVRLRDRSDLSTFLDPVGKQARHIELALEDRPALVIAVDFMFWFGYGSVRGAAEDVPDARLALQAQGLALLERLDAPILLGDYPDMRGADLRMLSASQIPSPDTLAALNQALRDWAAPRPNVHLFPLAAFVAAVKRDGAPVRIDGEELQLPAEALLQSDRLHTTRLGVAVLGARIHDAILETLADDDPLRPQELSFASLLDATRARWEFDELFERR